MGFNSGFKGLKSSSLCCFLHLAHVLEH